MNLKEWQAKIDQSQAEIDEAREKWHVIEQEANRLRVAADEAWSEMMRRISLHYDLNDACYADCRLERSVEGLPPADA